MDTIYTLQDFMLHSKSITYLLMGAAVVGMLGFFLYLTGRDNDNKYDPHHEE